MEAVTVCCFGFLLLLLFLGWGALVRSSYAICNLSFVSVLSSCLFVA